MKSGLIRSLSACAAVDPAVMLLTGDLGFGAFESFVTEFPSQFLNCGVAEQNMLGVAAGLAAEGQRPAVYSIGNFLILRAAEQIRNDIVAPGRPVLMVAAGAGFNYGAAGYSHHLTEDLAYVRTLPGLTVFTPALASDIAPMVSGWHENQQPVYLRLERESVYECDSLPEFKLGEWRPILTGSDLTIFAVGSAIREAIEAAEKLSKMGNSATVFDCNQLTGLSPDFLDRVLSSTRLAVSIEEHSIRGGLGSLLAEEITERGLGIRLLRFGLQGTFSKLAGGQQYLRAQHGITSDHVVESVSHSAR